MFGAAVISRSPVQISSYVRLSRYSLYGVKLCAWVTSNKVKNV